MRIAPRERVAENSAHPWVNLICSAVRTTVERSQKDSWSLELLSWVKTRSKETGIRIEAERTSKVDALPVECNPGSPAKLDSRKPTALGLSCPIDKFCRNDLTRYSRRWKPISRGLSSPPITIDYGFLMGALSGWSVGAFFDVEILKLRPCWQRPVNTKTVDHRQPNLLAAEILNDNPVFEGAESRPRFPNPFEAQMWVRRFVNEHNMMSIRFGEIAPELP